MNQFNFSQYFSQQRHKTQNQQLFQSSSGLQLLYLIYLLFTRKINVNIISGILTLNSDIIKNFYILSYLSFYLIYLLSFDLILSHLISLPPQLVQFTLLIILVLLRYQLVYLSKTYINYYKKYLTICQTTQESKQSRVILKNQLSKQNMSYPSFQSIVYQSVEKSRRNGLQSLQSSQDQQKQSIQSFDKNQLGYQRQQPQFQNTKPEAQIKENLSEQPPHQLDQQKTSETQNLIYHKRQQEIKYLENDQSQMQNHEQSFQSITVQKYSEDEQHANIQTYHLNNSNFMSIITANGQQQHQKENQNQNEYENQNQSQKKEENQNQNQKESCSKIQQKNVEIKAQQQKVEIKVSQKQNKIQFNNSNNQNYNRANLNIMTGSKQSQNIERIPSIEQFLLRLKSYILKNDKKQENKQKQTKKPKIEQNQCRNKLALLDILRIFKAEDWSKIQEFNQINNGNEDKQIKEKENKSNAKLNRKQPNLTQIQANLLHQIKSLILYSNCDSKIRRQIICPQEQQFLKVIGLLQYLELLNELLLSKQKKEQNKQSKEIQKYQDQKLNQSIQKSSCQLDNDAKQEKECADKKDQQKEINQNKQPYLFKIHFLGCFINEHIVLKIIELMRNFHKLKMYNTGQKMTLAGYAKQIYKNKDLIQVFNSITDVKNSKEDDEWMLKKLWNNVFNQDESKTILFGLSKQEYIETFFMISDDFKIPKQFVDRLTRYLIKQLNGYKQLVELFAKYLCNSEESFSNTTPQSNSIIKEDSCTLNLEASFLVVYEQAMKLEKFIPHADDFQKKLWSNNNLWYLIRNLSFLNTNALKNDRQTSSNLFGRIQSTILFILESTFEFDKASSDQLYRSFQQNLASFNNNEKTDRIKQSFGVMFEIHYNKITSDELLLMLERYLNRNSGVNVQKFLANQKKQNKKYQALALSNLLPINAQNNKIKKVYQKFLESKIQCFDITFNSLEIVIKNCQNQRERSKSLSYYFEKVKEIQSLSQAQLQKYTSTLTFLKKYAQIHQYFIKKICFYEEQIIKSQFSQRKLVLKSVLDKNLELIKQLISLSEKKKQIKISQIYQKIQNHNFKEAHQHFIFLECFYKTDGFYQQLLKSVSINRVTKASEDLRQNRIIESQKSYTIMQDVNNFIKKSIQRGILEHIEQKDQVNLIHVQKLICNSSSSHLKKLLSCNDSVDLNGAFDSNPFTLFKKQFPKWSLTLILLNQQKIPFSQANNSSLLQLMKQYFFFKTQLMDEKLNVEITIKLEVLSKQYDRVRQKVMKQGEGNCRLSQLYLLENIWKKMKQIIEKWLKNDFMIKYWQLKQRVNENYKNQQAINPQILNILNSLFTDSKVRSMLKRIFKLSEVQRQIFSSKILKRIGNLSQQIEQSVKVDIIKKKLTKFVQLTQYVSKQIKYSPNGLRSFIEHLCSEYAKFSYELGEEQSKTKEIRPELKDKPVYKQGNSPIIQFFMPMLSSDKSHSEIAGNINIDHQEQQGFDYSTLIIDQLIRQTQQQLYRARYSDVVENMWEVQQVQDWKQQRKGDQNKDRKVDNSAKSQLETKNRSKQFIRQSQILYHNHQQINKQNYQSNTQHQISPNSNNPQSNQNNQILFKQQEKQERRTQNFNKFKNGCKKQAFKSKIHQISMIFCQEKDQQIQQLLPQERQQIQQNQKRYQKSQRQYYDLDKEGQEQMREQALNQQSEALDNQILNAYNQDIDDTPPKMQWPQSVKIILESSKSNTEDQQQKVESVLKEQKFSKQYITELFMKFFEFYYMREEEQHELIQKYYDQNQQSSYFSIISSINSCKDKVQPKRQLLESYPALLSPEGNENKFLLFFYVLLQMMLQLAQSNNQESINSHSRNLKFINFKAFQQLNSKQQQFNINDNQQNQSIQSKSSQQTRIVLELVFQKNQLIKKIFQDYILDQDQGSQHKQKHDALKILFIKNTKLQQQPFLVKQILENQTIYYKLSVKTLLGRRKLQQE